MSDADQDSLDVLTAHLWQGEPIPLWWSVRWSTGGFDPLTAAWIASDNWIDMLTLLGWERHDPVPRPDTLPALARARIAQLKMCVQRELVGVCPEGEWYRKPKRCTACAVAIRSAVPELPITLAELMTWTGDDLPR